MRRVVALLTLAGLLAFGGGRWASAHGLILYGHIAVSPQGEVSVKIVDVYGALVEGQRATVYATQPGGRSTRPVDLKEETPGTYRGLLQPPPGAAEYELTVDMELGGDLHRILLPLKAGQGQPEQRVPMVPIDPPEGTDWGRVLYAGAAVILIAATAVALLKRRPAAEGE